MPIPDLNSHGLLPAGVHDCSWQQARTRFAYNPHRRAVLKGLCRFVRDELLPLGLPAPIYLDGSFVRGKPNPADVDVVLDLSAYDQVTAAPALALWFDHDRIKQQYLVDYWPKHPIVPNDLSSFFQYLGDKAASELGLARDWPKGILRITP